MKLFSKAHGLIISSQVEMWWSQTSIVVCSCCEWTTRLFAKSRLPPFHAMQNVILKEAVHLLFTPISMYVGFKWHSFRAFIFSAFVQIGALSRPFV